MSTTRSPNVATRAETMLTWRPRYAYAAVYTVAFAVNLIGCAVLIPAMSILGAAAATSAAMLCEPGDLYFVVGRRLGIRAFVFSQTADRHRQRVTQVRVHVWREMVALRRGLHFRPITQFTRG